MRRTRSPRSPRPDGPHGVRGGEGRPGVLLPGLGERTRPGGITVNSVAPGPTETKLFWQHNPEGSESVARYRAASRVGRFGRPEEIAAAIAFLLSDEAGYITGQTLRVDGGGSLGGA
ncbi:SDR family oxidoreductase [Micromonospora sp. NPDC023814]|uniref:SDR family oxidoreductase n=1 Tax=Micromonospora sp. NPDC023814 TaxID=3154596 RepID=UPI0033C13D62